MRTLLTVLLVFVALSSHAQGSGFALRGATPDHLDCGPGMNDLDFPYTMEAWVKLDNVASEPRAIWDSGVEPGGDYYGAWIVISAARKITIAYGDGTGASDTDRRSIFSIPSIPLGRWVHICGVQDGPLSGRIYINGIEVNTTRGGTGGTSIEHFPSARQTIGYHASILGGAWLNGVIDEVRIWDIARTEEEIRASMCRKVHPLTPGLAAYWRMDEGSGTMVSDLSGNGHDGSFVGGSMSWEWSGAPLGDASAYIYPSSWVGAAVSIEDSGANERLEAYGISSPGGEGFHVFRVDDVPNSTVGLDAGTPSTYFGTFGTSTLAEYSCTMRLLDPPCPSCDIVLDARNANDSGTWTDLGASPIGTDGCAIRVDNESGMDDGWRSEYAWINLEDACEDATTDTCAWILPNAFSPNGDGINDYFGFPDPGCLVQSSMHWAIYNRWGENIFSSSSPHSKWDGTWRGKEQELGVYTWTLQYTSPSANSPQFDSGTITLIR